MAAAGAAAIETAWHSRIIFLITKEKHKRRTRRCESRRLSDRTERNFSGEMEKLDEKIRRKRSTLYAIMHSDRRRPLPRIPCEPRV